MKYSRVLLCISAAALFCTAFASAQSGTAQSQGQAILTILPKGGEFGTLTPANLRIKVDGKPALVTALTPLRGPANPIELVILIDSGARTSLGGQLGELTHFVQETPSDTKIALAYMQNGQAVLATPLTSDPAQAERGIHIPIGSAGSSASPYFCLSDLARNWPSSDPRARREVLMITDGIDAYNRRFDPNDPYVQTAIADALHARLVVHSIYWTSRGNADDTAAASNTGQSLLSIVSAATGGVSYWQGAGNPISFDSYFVDLRHRLRNQYLLTVSVSQSGKSAGKTVIASLDLKGTGLSTKIDAPQEILLRPLDLPAK
jgi:hypothetical protein